MARVLVAGIGNVLASDDGLGPFAARRLAAQWEFEPPVEVLDAGTPGLDLVSLLDGLDAVVLVDAVRAPGAPGDVVRLDRGALLGGEVHHGTSAHDLGLREALRYLESTGRSPSDVTLWGAVPGSTAMGASISPAVRGAVPRVLDGVLGELRRLGVTATRRARPHEPESWWERNWNLGLDPKG